MQNIVVVCLDYDCALKIGKQLSNILNMQLYNADEFIKNSLLNTLDYPIIISNEIMQIKENAGLIELSKKEKVVITITDDEFISNGNYKLFKNSFIILLEIDTSNKIKQNIQKLIKKHCETSVIIKNLEINNLISKIRG